MLGGYCSTPQSWLVCMCFVPWIYLKVRPPLGLCWRLSANSVRWRKPPHDQNLDPFHMEMCTNSQWNRKNNKKPMANTIIWDIWDWARDFDTPLFIITHTLTFIWAESSISIKNVDVVSRLSYFTLTFLMVLYSHYSNLTQNFLQVGFFFIFLALKIQCSI